MMRLTLGLYLTAHAAWLCLTPGLCAAAWTETAKLVGEGTPAGSWAGGGPNSVGISGSTVIVGAAQPNRVGPGEAYIFQDDGLGWMQTAKLTAPDGAVNQYFGRAVAIDGNIAVATATQAKSGDVTTGAAYVFEFTGAVWQQIAKLTADDGALGDLFGSDVAISGSTIIVGADHDEDQGHFTGAAYIFQDLGSGWTQTAKLTASDQAAFDGFGYSVDVQGSTALVGAVDEGGRAGAVYVYEDSGNGWQEVDKWSANDPVGTTGGFGGSLALDGDRAVVGAFRDGEHGAGSGAAYIFDKSGGTWGETAKLIAGDTAAGDQFGVSVALWQDLLVVGAFQNDGASLNSGAAYLFEFDGAAWRELDKLTVAPGEADDLFGYSVAVDGANVVATVLGDDEVAEKAGAAFVFRPVPEPAANQLIIGVLTALWCRRRGHGHSRSASACRSPR
ncbi:MAG: FG-GAP repeat protein [Pirellulales bacterium]